MSESPSLLIDVRVPLDRFTLAVAFESRAKVIGLWGPSGSGKTTLVETLAGLRGGATGQIACGTRLWLDTATGVSVRPEHRAIGYVPQDSLLFPNLSVRGNLAAGARRARDRAVSPTRAGELVDRAAHVLRIESLLDRDVSSLSGGERQRVALARALCSRPSFLLLDEPFASLDVPLRRELLPFLAQVRDEAEVPMLLVSHDPTEIQILCEEVIALREGKIVAQGHPREVIGAARSLSHDQSQGFENILRGTVTECAGSSAQIGLDAPQGESAISLIVPLRSSVTVGAPVFVGLSSRDILIAKGELGLLSARNRLRAEVTRIDQQGPAAFVHVRIHGASEDLTVEVTPKAILELALSPEDEVTVIFKASACTLYALNP